ncbi:hypothetical protein PO814_001105 [Cronobacter sakazakii]|nr:hypothetical protein [Cronobacter sakazakii]
MELTSTRKRANAITSNIFNRIAIRGQRNIASQLGVDESQITRWKSSMIPKMSMLLAILEWGVEDEELSNLAKQVALLLTKDKAPKNGEFLEAEAHCVTPSNRSNYVKNTQS